MLNVCMLVKDRPQLTAQAIKSLYKHTDVPFNLTVVDDGSKPETREMLKVLSGGLKNIAVLRNETSKGITGQARNLAVYWSERYFGRGDYLYLSDNDVYFMENWASKLIAIYRESPDCLVLGGARHPYHQFNTIRDGCGETDAVAGYSQLMEWEIWDDYGPLDAHAPGVCQSEDFAFCRKIIEDGLKVGYVTEPVIIDCGLTRTDGTPAIGHEAKPRIPGVIYG